MHRNPLITASIYLITSLSLLPSLSSQGSLVVAASLIPPSTNESPNKISCGNGIQGQTVHIQHGVAEPFQPDIYVTDCSGLKPLSPSHDFAESAQDSDNVISSQLSRFGKRQISKCDSSCATLCGFGTGPSDNDCAGLSNWLENRGSQFTVGAFQKVSFAFGTCIYTFTNTNFLPVQWCDSTWAAQGG
ncbi:hypothetical protein FRB91_005960, partial [Serendipita sp. 411]